MRDNAVHEDPLVEDGVVEFPVLKNRKGIRFIKMDHTMFEMVEQGWENNIGYWKFKIIKK